MPNARTVIESLIAEGNEVLRVSNPAQQERAWMRWNDRLAAETVRYPVLAELPPNRHWRTLSHVVTRLRALLARVDAVPVKAAEPVAAAPAPAPPRADVATGPVRVFLSYRHEESHVAKTLQALFERLYEDRVKIFVADSDMRAGMLYRQQLNQEIAAAHWFVLLFTDAEGDWQWPIAEAARFEVVQSTLTRNKAGETSFRLCVLHGTDAKPRPLQEYQSYRAELASTSLPEDEQQAYYEKHSEIGQFFRQFEGYVRQREGREAAPGPSRAKLLSEVARDLCQAFVVARSERVLEKHYYAARVELTLRETGSGELEPIEHGAVYLGHRAQEIFDIQRGRDGLADRPHGQADAALDWQGFLKRVAERSTGGVPPLWIEQLQQAVQAAVDRRTPDPVTALMASKRTRRYYRPVLSTQEVLVGGVRRFYILFVEQLPFDFRSHDLLGTLMAALILSSRFRFELIGERLQALRRAKSLQTIREVASAMQAQITVFEGEAAAHGLMEPESLLRCFAGDERDAIEDTYEAWYGLRPVLMLRFAQVQQADTAAGAEEARDQLDAFLIDELKPLNGRLLEICSRRYHEIMAAEVGSKGTQHATGRAAGKGAPRGRGAKGTGSASGKPSRKTPRKAAQPARKATAAPRGKGAKAGPPARKGAARSGARPGRGRGIKGGH